MAHPGRVERTIDVLAAPFAATALLAVMVSIGWKLYQAHLFALSHVPPPPPAPCPAGSHDQLVARHLAPTRFFSFEGVEYGRRFGDAECVLRKTHMYIGGKRTVTCQFSSPGAVEVKTPTGLYAYPTGMGVGATVTFGDGETVPKCVADSDISVHKMLEGIEHMRAPLVPRP